MVSVRQLLVLKQPYISDRRVSPTTCTVCSRVTVAKRAQVQAVNGTHSFRPIPESILEQDEGM